MKKKRRGGLSAGTIAMLVLTACVLVAMAAFLFLIAGDGVYERAYAAFNLLAETQKPTDAPSPEPTIKPLDTPAATVMPTAEPTAEPTPSPGLTTFTLAAAGTVYAPKAIRESAQESGGHYDFLSVLNGIGDTLSAADLTIVTLETTTAGREKGYGNYNTTPEILDALRACGVDLVALATERALDRGYDGLDLTLSELTSRSLAYAGVYPYSENGSATMMNINGVQVAVLAYSYGLSDEGKAQTKNDSRGVLALIDAQKMAQDITRARVDGANVVIVLPHWGTKNRAETPESVRVLANTLAQAGADVILGTHPNVAQGVERIHTVRSDGLTYETVVCYSLGCLLTDARSSENTAGMAVNLTLVYDSNTRRAYPGEMKITPLYIASQRKDGKNVYRVVDAEDEQALSKLTIAEQQSAAQAVLRVRQAVKGE